MAPGKNAEYKTKLDLFDRRYAVYESVVTSAEKYANDFGGEIIHTWADYSDPIWKSRFLFDEPVTKALNEVADAVTQLTQAYYQKDREVYGSDPGDVSEQELIRRNRQQAEWNARDRIRQKVQELGHVVLPYLSFKTVGLESRVPGQLISLARKIKDEAESMR